MLDKMNKTGSGPVAKNYLSYLMLSVWIFIMLFMFSYLLLTISPTQTFYSGIVPVQINEDQSASLYIENGKIEDVEIE